MTTGYLSMVCACTQVMTTGAYRSVSGSPRHGPRAGSPSWSY
ncbi:hypothetical protein ACFOLD_01920 [Kocuria carniphila]